MFMNTFMNIVHERVHEHIHEQYSWTTFMNTSCADNKFGCWKTFVHEHVHMFMNSRIWRICSWTIFYFCSWIHVHERLYCSWTNILNQKRSWTSSQMFMNVTYVFMNVVHELFVHMFMNVFMNIFVYEQYFVHEYVHEHIHEQNIVHMYQICSWTCSWTLLRELLFMYLFVHEHLQQNLCNSAIYAFTYFHLLFVEKSWFDDFTVPKSEKKD